MLLQCCNILTFQLQLISTRQILLIEIWTATKEVAPTAVPPPTAAVSLDNPIRGAWSWGCDVRSPGVVGLAALMGTAAVAAAAAAAVAEVPVVEVVAA
jgi:hypothetical protein